MKKILIIPSWYPSVDHYWSGTFFRDQALLMQDQFDIRILAGKLKKTSRLNRIINTLYFLLTSRVRVKNLPSHYPEPPQVFGFEYPDKINRFKKLNRRYEISAYRRFYKKTVKKWRPDLIHAHATFMAGIISHSLSKENQIPYIITEHNHPAFSKMKVTSDNAYLTAINQAARLLLVGKSLSSALDLSGLKHPVEVVGNYVDENKFSLSLPDNSGKFVVLFVGFFITEKDYDTLTATIKKFSEITTDPDFRFRIVGCGEEGKKKIVDDLQHDGVINKVEIFPYVSREEIPEFHKSCNVFLSTSRLETFGIAMCETMMCGKPVVSTDNKGFDEMYVPEVNGIKCRAGDAAGLAEALIALQKKEIVFDPIAIRNSVLEKFGTQAFRQKLLAVYSEALNN